MIKPILMLAGVALAAGCASYPAPNDHVATAMASQRAAQELGAQNNPQAALELRLAQEENTKAKQLIENGDNERADYMAMRANADAQLAVMLMREQAAKTKANDSLAKLQEVGAKTTTTSATQPSVVPVPIPVPVAVPVPVPANGTTTTESTTTTTTTKPSKTH